MITARTKKQLIVFAIITLLGVVVRGRPLRPARPAVLRLGVHRRRALRAVRRHLHRRRGDLPRRRDRPGLEDEAHQQGRRRRCCRSTRATTRSRRTPWRWWATSRPWVSSTSSCSRRPTAGPTSRTAPRSTRPDTEVPVSTTEILTNLDNLLESVPQADLRTVVAEFGRRVQGRRPEPRPDHRHLELLHQDRRGQLRHHHGPDPRLPHGAADPGRQGLGDPQLLQEPGPVLAARSPPTTSTSAR